jgi:ribosomal protein L4
MTAHCQCRFDVLHDVLAQHPAKNLAESTAQRCTGTQNEWGNKEWMKGGTGNGRTGEHEMGVWKNGEWELGNHY